MQRHGFLLAGLVMVLGGSRGSAEDAWPGAMSEGEAPGPALFNVPRFSLAYGSISQKVENVSGKFREDFAGGTLGWDVVFHGHDSLSLEFELLQSAKEENTGAGTESDILRWGVTGGYLYSSWDRSIPPSKLDAHCKAIRLAAGINAFFRQQEFEIDLTGSDTDQTFDMFGGEIVLQLEVAPRHILAPFATLRAGGSYVAVETDSDDDTRIDTGSAHLTAEAGVLTQFNWHCVLKLGYRYNVIEFFEEETFEDTTTEAHTVFVEAAFPF